MQSPRGNRLRALCADALARDAKSVNAEAKVIKAIISLSLPPLSPPTAPFLSLFLSLSPWEILSSAPFNAPITRRFCAPGNDTAHYYYREVPAAPPLRCADTLRHRLLITHYHGGLYRNVVLRVARDYSVPRNKASVDVERRSFPRGNISPARLSFQCVLSLSLCFFFVFFQMLYIRTAARDSTGENCYQRRYYRA